MPLLSELVEDTFIAGVRVGEDEDLLSSMEVGLSGIASEAGCGEDGSTADSGACD